MLLEKEKLIKKLINLSFHVFPVLKFFESSEEVSVCNTSRGHSLQNFVRFNTVAFCLEILGQEVRRTFLGPEQCYEIGYFGLQFMLSQC